MGLQKCCAQESSRPTLEDAETAFLSVVASESNSSGAASDDSDASGGGQSEKRVLTLGQIEAMAIQGSGFGVLTLKIFQPPKGMRLDSLDANLQVSSDECRIWFPAIQLTRSDSDKVAQELTVRCLFDAGAPKSIDLYANGRKLLQDRLLVEESEITRDESATAVATLRWWEAFCQQSSRFAPEELRESNRNLLLALGNHLGGLSTLQPIGDNSASQLEKEFERTIGMLLGFESVRLAMMTEDRSLRTDSTPVDLRLPGSLNVASVQVPNQANLKDVVVPSIARLVPPDCYMVRCKSLENYTWLRSLLMDWGGSLDDVIAGSMIESTIRPRLEKQLAISAEAMSASGGEHLIQDLAVIGSDLLFENGAGVGVLMQAKPGNLQKLKQIIDSQRAASGVVLKQTRVDGIPVSYLQEAGNRVRSFMLVVDDCILVTNSTQITQSVIRAKQSGASLGDLNEFKYAMATNPGGRKSEISFYLSDPFFRRIASAPFRIELSRRRAAAADCRELTAAQLVANSLGYIADTKAALIEKQFLPKGFGVRSDGSNVDISAGEPIDSLRGRPGTFVPVVDVHVTRCNSTERQAYTTFSQRYRSEWRVMDPVFATLDAFPIDDTQERLNLSVHITPYARGEYQFLSQYLRSATRSYLSAGENELMGVSANLSDGGTTYNAHLGLMDQSLDFEVIDGQVLVDGTVRKDMFAKDSSFAVVTPANTQGLFALNGLMKSLQERRPIKIAQPNSPQPRSIAPPSGSNPYSLLRSILQPQDLLVQAGMVVFEGFLNLSALSNLSQEGQWAIYASDPDIHSKLRRDLVIRESLLPAEIHAFVRNLEDSQIQEYLNAYSYCASRKKSAQVAAWLNFWSNGSKVNPAALLRAIESSEGGRVTCPLGGEWKLSHEQQAIDNSADSVPIDSDEQKELGRRRWVSTAWREQNLNLVDSAPLDSEHPFFRWFREMELQFSLNNTSLDSNIQVTYQPSQHVGGKKVLGEAPLAEIQPQSSQAVLNQSTNLQVSDSSTASVDSRPFQIGNRVAIQQILPKPTTRSGSASQPMNRVQPASASSFGQSTLFPAPRSDLANLNRNSGTSPSNALRSSRPRREQYSSEIGIRVYTSTLTVGVIKPGLPASRSTLHVGDKILAVNGMQISSVEELRSRLSLASQTRSNVTLRIERQRRQLFVQINLTPLPDTDL